MSIFSALEARIVGFKEEGKTPRPWYGVSHFDIPRGQYVLYPIPLNLVSAFCRFAYVCLKTGFFLSRTRWMQELRMAYKAGRREAMGGDEIQDPGGFLRLLEESQEAMKQEPQPITLQDIAGTLARMRESEEENMRRYPRYFLDPFSVLTIDEHNRRMVRGEKCACYLCV